MSLPGVPIGAFAPRPPNLVLSLLFVLLSLPHPAAAGVDTSGRWAGTWNWGYTAVHLMLIPPGSSGYHSRVVWWEDTHKPGLFEGGMWGWTATSGADCTANSDSLFHPISMGTAPTSDVFCAGHTHMKDGRIFVSGGTEAGEVGIKTTFVFDADVTSKWISGPPMVNRRWYPTNTRLADGSLMVSSGSQYTHEYIFGGRKTGDTPLNSKLRRLGLPRLGLWDTAVQSSSTPSYPDWPPTSEGHSLVASELGFTLDDGYIDRDNVVNMLFGGDTLKSGKRNSSSLLWFFYRVPNQTTGDYGYYFNPVTPLFTSGSYATDFARSDFSMTTMAHDSTDQQSMFVFGGRRFRETLSTQLLGDVWRLYYDENHVPKSWTAANLGVLSSGPSARFGHTAVYDPFHRRILFFGGTSDSTNAIDNTVYALNVNTPSAPTWTTTTVTGWVPAARFGHRMMLDFIGRSRVVNGVTLTNQYGAVLFGGKTAGGLEDSVHVLWMNTAAESLRLDWQTVATSVEGGGSGPSGRVFHTLTKDETNDRWMVFGGDTGGSPDLRAWALGLSTANAATAVWTQMSDNADISVTGGGAIFSAPPIFERIAEKYSANGGSPTTLSSTVLLQDWFPFTWVLPDSSVFSLATGGNSYRLTAPGATWGAYPTGGTNNVEGIDGGSAVMFKPGMILTAGSRAGVEYPTTVSPHSRWIQPLASGASWQDTGNDMSIGHANLNLVSLPNGKVLAVGGTHGQGGVSDTQANLHPELWDPDYISGTGKRGRWYGADTLAAQTMLRDYHSTALLLPDGRILSAGGNASATDKVKAEIFCPPYLFKSNGSLAPRPTITGAPSTIRYGSIFTVCTPEAANIKSIALIAPGAPTHAFDQDQRFIPLTSFHAETSPSRLLVTAPSGAGLAPPGYYMLFILGNADGSGTYPDVPSIATWVQIDPLKPLDLCDTARPDTVTGLDVDVITPSSIYLYWFGPADDGVDPYSGNPQSFDMRYRTTAFDPNNSATWTGAHQVSGEAIPGAVGSEGYGAATGLSANSWYYLAVRATDDAPAPDTLSGYHVTLKVKTSTGGGGSSVQPTGASAAGLMPIGPGDAESNTLTPATDAGLTVTTASIRGGGWRVTVCSEANVAGFTSSDAGAVTMQSPSETAGWDTRRRFVPGVNEGSLSLCGLHDRSRTALLGSYGLAQVAGTFANNTGRFQLASAVHSRTGALSLIKGEALSPSLALGDTLVLTYEPTSGASDTDESWYVMVGKTSGTPSSRMQPGHGSGLKAPTAFALGQNVPNPFRGTTAIQFALPTGSTVRIEIFDLLGRRIRTLADGLYGAGYHTVEWDRRDGSGNSVQAGVFTYRMIAGQYRASRKMVIGVE